MVSVDISKECTSSFLGDLVSGTQYKGIFSDFQQILSSIQKTNESVETNNRSYCQNDKKKKRVDNYLSNSKPIDQKPVESLPVKDAVKQTEVNNNPEDRDSCSPSDSGSVNQRSVEGASVENLNSKQKNQRSGSASNVDVAKNEQQKTDPTKSEKTDNPQMTQKVKVDILSQLMQDIPIFIANEDKEKPLNLDFISMEDVLIMKSEDIDNEKLIAGLMNNLLVKIQNFTEKVEKVTLINSLTPQEKDMVLEIANKTKKLVTSLTDKDILKQFPIADIKEMSGIIEKMKVSLADTLVFAQKLDDRRVYSKKASPNLILEKDPGINKLETSELGDDTKHYSKTALTNNELSAGIQNKSQQQMDSKQNQNRENIMQGLVQVKDKVNNLLNKLNGKIDVMTTDQGSTTMEFKLEQNYVRKQNEELSEELISAKKTIEKTVKLAPKKLQEAIPNYSASYHNVSSQSGDKFMVQSMGQPSTESSLQANTQQVITTAIDHVQPRNIEQINASTAGAKIDKIEQYKAILNQFKSFISSQNLREAKKLTLHLQPRELGDVRITIQRHAHQDQQVIVARIEVDSQVVKEAFESGFSEFKDSLEQQGMSLGQFAINVKQQKNSRQNQDKFSFNPDVKQQTKKVVSAVKISSVREDNTISGTVSFDVAA